MGRPARDAAAKAEGLCVDCRKPNDRLPKARCTGCAKKLGKAQSAARKDRLSRNLCPKCGKEPASNLRSRFGPRCVAIIAACPSVGTNATRTTRLAAGQCIGCGIPLEAQDGAERQPQVEQKKRTRCPDCMAAEALKGRQRKADRIAAGVCPCGKRPPALGDTRCAICIATPHTARWARVPALARDEDRG